MAYVFQASREQLLQLLLNAYNASIMLELPDLYNDEIVIDIDYFNRFVAPTVYCEQRESAHFEVLNNKQMNIYIDEVDTFNNYKHWIFYENEFDSNVTSCSYKYDIKSLIESVNGIIVNNNNINELPMHLSLKLYMLIYNNNGLFSFKLRDKSEFTDILNRLYKEIDNSALYHTHSSKECDSIIFNDFEIKVCRGFVAETYADAQMLANSKVIKCNNLVDFKTLGDKKCKI